MRSFLTIVLTLQFLFSLMPLNEAFRHATLAGVSSTPATFSLLSLILLFIIAFCMMYGGVSQEDGRPHTTPMPDNAHGGWWNLGRFDMLILTTLLLSVCAYGTSFSQLSYYSMPDSFFRPLVTLNELPTLLLQDTAIWLAAFLLVFLLSLLVRLCRGGKPGSVAVASSTALLALVGLLFVAVLMHQACKTGQRLSSPGSLFVIVSTICCYKAVRCVSLRCLLPEWAGGWHEGGLTPAAAEPTVEEQIVATDTTSTEDTTPPEAPQPALPASPAQPPVLHMPASPRLKGRHISYALWGGLAIGSGIFMARWSDKALYGITKGEGCVFGILFGISVITFGVFVLDALRKAFREYHAERPEKAVPYAVLGVLVLGLWFALFAGLAALMR